MTTACSQPRAVGCVIFTCLALLLSTQISSAQSRPFVLRNPLPFDVPGAQVKYFPSHQLFVALGDDLTLAISKHGDAWSTLSTHPTCDATDLKDVTFGNGVFVAVGVGGLDPTTNLTSTNGLDWFPAPLVAPFEDLTSVAFGSGRFVATTVEPSIIRHSTNGTNWAVLDLDPAVPGLGDVRLNDVVFAAGQFVLVGNLDSPFAACLTSSDGLVWTRRDPATTKNLLAVTYAPLLNGYVAVGQDNVVTLSSDGVTWNPINAPFPFDGADDLLSVAADNERIVVGSFNGYLASSTNISIAGASWALQDVPRNRWITATAGEAYGKDTFVVLGNEGGLRPEILQFVNGSFWLSRVERVASSLLQIRRLNNRFVAVGNSGAIVDSANGFSWTRRSPGSTRTLRDVAFGQGHYVAVGDSGEILSSPDGLQWTRELPPAGFNQNINGIHFASNQFVAVGASARILTSSNRVNWIAGTFGPSQTFNKVTQGGNSWIAVGSSLTEPIYRSLDNAINWSSAPNISGTRAPLVGVAASPAGTPAFLTVGDRDIARSNDGASWSPFSVEPAKATGVIRGNGEYATVLNIPFAGTRHLLSFQTTVDGSLFTALPSVCRNHTAVAHGSSSYIVLTDVGSIYQVADSSALPPRIDFRTNLVLTAGFPYVFPLTSFPPGATIGVGPLPLGLTFDPSRRQIAGAPDLSQVGQHAIPVGLTNLFGTALTTINLTIVAEQAPVITASLDALAQMLVPFDYQITANNNPTHFSVNQLPPGLELDTTTGRIFGVPTQVGITRCQVTAGNFFGTDQQELTIRVLTSVEPRSWNWANPLPSSHDFVDVAFGNGRYVTVGGRSTRYGVSAVSRDGATWSIHFGPSPVAFRSVAFGTNSFGQAMFVAGSDDDSFFVSFDGETWTAQSTPCTSCQFHSIANANGRFVAVATSGRVFYSDDAAVWVQSNATGSSRTLRDITHGNGIFVAVGDYNDADLNILTSVDQGLNWTKRQAGNANLTSVLFDPSRNRFVAAAVDGNIYTSPNSVTWTLASDAAPSTDSINGLSQAFLGSSDVILAVGNRQSGTGFLAYSEDGGGTWNTDMADVSNQTLEDAVHGPFGFVAVGDRGAIIASIDEEHTQFISRRRAFTSNPIRRIQFVNSQFLAVGTSGLVARSPNGRIWSVAPSFATTSLNDIEYQDGLYLAVGDSGTIAISTDLDTWLVQNSGTGTGNLFNNLTAVTYGASRWIAVGSGGVIIQSSDAEVWTGKPSGTSQQLNDVAFGNGVFVAIGNTGTLLASLNSGETWTQQNFPAPPSTTWRRVIFDGTRFILVGADAVLQSLDGTTWTGVTIQLSPALDIASLDTGYAVLSATRVGFSPDLNLFTYSDPQLQDFDSLTALAFGNRTLVAAGASGLVIYSESGQPQSPEIVSPFLGRGPVNETFYFRPTVLGSPHGFSLTGSLPLGIAFDPFTGEFSGQGLAPSSTTVTLTATNASGSDTAEITLVVDDAAPPAILSTLAATVIRGRTFQYDTVASNGPLAYSADNLPSGLSIDPNTGIIRGTTAAAPGEYPVILNAFNAYGRGAATLTLTLANPPPPVIISPTNAIALRSFPFRYQIVATERPNGYDASPLNSPGPGGLVRNSLTGLISGNPNSVGTFHLTLTATNFGGSATSPLQLLVQPHTPGQTNMVVSLYSSPLQQLVDQPVDLLADPILTIGQVQSVQFLDNGTVFSTDTNAPFQSTFTRSTPGSRSLTARAFSDNGLTVDSPIVNVSFTNSAGVDGVPRITSPLMATGRVGVAFNYAITADNAPSSFNALNLPAGLSVATNTGFISGSPTSTATNAVILLASNFVGVGSNTLQLLIEPPVPQFTSPTYARGSNGIFFAYQAQASGNPSYQALGLPIGLTLNGVTGRIFGTPLTPLTTNITLRATNPSGVGTTNLLLEIVDGIPIITSPSTATGVRNVPLQYQIVATANPSSFGADNLPIGLTVDPITGLISGTPQFPGARQARIIAGNALGSDTNVLNFTIEDSSVLGAPQITSPIIASGAIGFPFSYQITATRNPNSFGATPLPPGLTVNMSSGLINGTPTEIGMTTTTVTASNAEGTGLTNVVITITTNAPPEIVGSLTASGIVGSPFTYQIVATQSPTSYGASNLPAGLAINPTNGLIAGTPSIAGEYSVGLVARNVVGTGTNRLALTILDADFLGISGDLNGDGQGDVLLQRGAVVSLLTFNGTTARPALTLNDVPAKGKVLAANPNVFTNFVVFKVKRDIQVVAFGTNLDAIGTTTVSPTTRAAGKIVGAGDLNGDRQIDLLARKGKTLNLILGPSYDEFIAIADVPLPSAIGKAVGIFFGEPLSVIFLKGLSFDSALVETNASGVSLGTAGPFRGPTPKFRAITDLSGDTVPDLINQKGKDYRSGETVIYTPSSGEKLGKIVGPR